MPTYSYECEVGHSYEEVRGMSDPQQRTACPKSDCAKPLKRKFETTPIMFKGQGFYSNRG
jgi:putative FmdB family regulatory protein